MVTAPLDRLSLRLQHLDGTTGGGMLELCATPGILDRCFGTLWELLNDWSESDNMWFLLFLEWYLHDFGTSYNHLLDRHYSVCVGIAAALWARMVVVYSSYPFRSSCQPHTE